MGVEVALIGTIASAAFGAVSSIMQGQAQAQAAQYQMQVARNNEMIARQNATYARQAAAARVSQQNLRTAAMVGAIRAGQGAHGLDVNADTNVDVQGSAYALGKLDAENIRIAGEKEAHGYQTQAMNYAATAGLYDFASQQAQSAGFMNAFSSLIGGASGFANKWNQFSNAGLLSGSSSNAWDGITGWNPGW